MIIKKEETKHQTNSIRFFSCIKHKTKNKCELLCFWKQTIENWGELNQIWSDDEIYIYNISIYLKSEINYSCHKRTTSKYRFRLNRSVLLSLMFDINVCNNETIKVLHSFQPPRSDWRESSALSSTYSSSVQSTVCITRTRQKAVLCFVRDIKERGRGRKKKGVQVDSTWNHSSQSETVVYKSQASGSAEGHQQVKGWPPKYKVPLRVKKRFSNGLNAWLTLTHIHAHTDYEKRLLLLWLRSYKTIKKDKFLPKGNTKKKGIRSLAKVPTILRCAVWKTAPAWARGARVFVLLPVFAICSFQITLGFNINVNPGVLESPLDSWIQFVMNKCSQAALATQILPLRQRRE